ncbi:hypothetical protein ZWY2020_013067 [Hordeum vulgare]|nr:hypothetical protein ZWY2020_013067 [Hordeum vulgare]
MVSLVRAAYRPCGLVPPTATPTPVWFSTATIYTQTPVLFSTASTHPPTPGAPKATTHCEARYAHEHRMACAFFFDADPVGEPGVHALDACALCTKPLARDSDIFMYRGDTPFCSDECRHEQMRLDAACARQAAKAAAQSQKQFSSGTGSGRTPAVLEVSVAS